MTEFIRSTGDALQILYGLSLNTSNLRFRGQANSSWKVEPSIHRFDNLKRYQTVVFEELVLSYKPSQPLPPLTHTEFDLEWLMLCQHYGVATRMLDWSREILPALYFACDGEESKDLDGAIYICDQNDYQIFSQHDDHARVTQKLTFVSTNIVNPRMRAQSGCFMMWGHSPISADPLKSYDLAQYHLTVSAEHYYKKIIIPKGSKANILHELDKYYSITTDTFYLENSYFVAKYGPKFCRLEDDARLMVLYLTDSAKLSAAEKTEARGMFSLKCEDMLGGTNSLRSLKGIRRSFDPDSYWQS